MKEIIYRLPYRKDGEKLTREIKIDFVPNQRYKDFNAIQSAIIEITKRWNEYKTIEEEVGLLVTNKPKDFKKDLDVFKERLKQIEVEIKQFEDIPAKRFKLLKKILIDNGYKEDTELMDESFWDECVEPESINELIDAAINKDLNKKKIQA